MASHWPSPPQVIDFDYDAVVGNETFTETEAGWYTLRNALEIHFEQAWLRSQVQWPQTAAQLGLGPPPIYVFEERRGSYEPGEMDEMDDAPEEDELAEDEEEEEELWDDEEDEQGFQAGDWDE